MKTRTRTPRVKFYERPWTPTESFVDRSRTSACNTRIVNPRQVDSCSDSRNAKPNRITRGGKSSTGRARNCARLSDSSEKHLALRAREHLTNARSRKEKFSKFFIGKRRQKKKWRSRGKEESSRNHRNEIFILVQYVPFRPNFYLPWKFVLSCNDQSRRGDEGIEIFPVPNRSEPTPSLSRPSTNPMSQSQ